MFYIRSGWTDGNPYHDRPLTPCAQVRGKSRSAASASCLAANTATWPLNIERAIDLDTELPRWRTKRATMFADLVKTDEHQRAGRNRRKIKMLFARLKCILALNRLRLCEPKGAQTEFTLAAIAQNRRRLAKLKLQMVSAA